PWPIPRSAAQPGAPTVNGSMAGQQSSNANGTMPRKTPESTRAPPIRSDSQPPAGRNAVARNTKPAARKPVSAAVSANSLVSRAGRKVQNATKAEKDGN